MGRSTTPRYIVKIVEKAPPGMREVASTPGTWNVKSRTNVTGLGKPTNERLEAYVMEYAKSLKVGGVNEHISKFAGYIPYPHSAYVKDQFTGKIVAEWKAAMFQVFP